MWSCRVPFGTQNAYVASLTFMPSCLHVAIAFFRVLECIYKPCFDHVLRTLARKETLEGLVWLSESIEAYLTTF